MFIMAENLPNLPPGAVPPKPAEVAKVQPKKETVRINLPPKPSAAPTIKLPTPPAAAQAPAPPVPAAAPSAAPVTAPSAAPVARAAAPAAPRTPMPMAHSAAAGVSTIDKGLAIAVALVGVIGVVRVLMLLR